MNHRIGRDKLPQMLPVILHIGGSKISGHEFGISGAQIEWAVEHMGRSEGRPLNLYLCKEIF